MEKKNILNIGKIVIIVFSAYSVMANFIPFYEGSNPYFYGVNSVLFAEGRFSITNELLQETGLREFVPENWLITIHNTAVPTAGTGLMTMGAIFFLIGGYYSLFYLAPISYIILLVVSERVSTKLFGKYVGLMTLLILSSSNLLFRNSIQLQTESIFSLLFIIGIFYLIKFLKSKKNLDLLITTSVFTLATWFRLNGLVAFPLEIFVILICFLFQVLKKEKYSYMINTDDSFETTNSFRIILKKIKSKKTLKMLIILLIPWFIFLSSHTVYHEYNFGDPLTNYGAEQGFTNYDSSLSAVFKFEYKDYENIKQYSKYLLPYQIPAIYNSSDANFDNVLGNNWIGLISIGSLLAITTISFYTKDKRTEIFVLMMFILGIVWFFSSITLEHRAERGVPGRYMLPAFILSSMIFGYFLQKIIKKEVSKEKPILKILIKFSKIILIVILGIFFILAFYFSNPIQIIIEEGWNFKNPEELVKRYPLSLEGLTEDSVIVTNVGVRAVEYGFISFNPMLTKQISSDSVNLLEKIIKEGYDVNTFKIPFNVHEKNMINSLVNEHGFTLKDYSKTFCKMELSSYDKSISDENCINNEPIRKPKT